MPKHSTNSAAIQVLRPDDFIVAFLGRSPVKSGLVNVFGIAHVTRFHCVLIVCVELTARVNSAHELVSGPSVVESLLGGIFDGHGEEREGARDHHVEVILHGILFLLSLHLVEVCGGDGDGESDSGESFHRFCFSL